MESKKNKCVTIIDDKYPEFFKSKECPPFALFYEGNLELIADDRPIQSAVGNDGRMILGVSPVISESEFKLDYVIACESQDDLEKMKTIMHDKGIKLKNHTQPPKEQMI